MEKKIPMFEVMNMIWDKLELYCIEDVYEINRDFTLKNGSKYGENFLLFKKVISMIPIIISHLVTNLEWFLVN